MRSRTLSVRSKGLLAIAAPIVALAGAAAVIGTAVQAQRNAEQELQATLRVDEATEHALRLLVDTETAVRGYLLTRDESFLEPLYDAQTDIGSALAAVATAVGDDPVQRPRAEQLDGIARRRVALAVETSQATGDIVTSLEEGKTAMDDARAIAGEIRSDEHARRARLSQEIDDRNRQLGIAVVVATTLGAGGGVLGVVVFARGIAGRLRRIEVGAEALASGEVPMALPVGDDEVGRVAVALRRTSDLLAERQRSLDDERLFREYLTATAAPAATFIESLPDGALVHVSANAPRIVGWSIEEINARGIHALVTAIDRERFEQVLGAADRGTASTATVRIDRHDGGTRWADIVILAAGTDERQIHVYFVSDVDEAHRAREEAEQLRVVAEDANQAKNDFLSRMSHELRTPLNAILGFTQLLELDPLEPAQEEAVGQIMRAGRHLLGLINEVLDISRIETGRLAVSSEPVPIADIFDQAWELLAMVARSRGITLHMVEPIDRKIHVRADQQRLKQVFVNLLSNAVKYSTRDSEVTVSSAARDDRFRIVLSDAGPGIAPEKLPRLFQPFERLGLETQEGAAEGIGLGLALSKALVEAMGGEIGVESSPGAGTSFWVDLELAFPPDHDVIDVEPEAGLPHGLGVILYIEDNPSNLRLVERVLERRPGIRLVGASSGAEGMRQVADLAPQLVLLDLDLPDMRGEEVLDRLRGEPWGREVPIVVLSADATPGLTRRLSQLGSTAHLTKPVDIQSLLDTVDDLIGEPL